MAFSGLYGDLPSAKDDDKKTGGSWAGSGHLAPTKRPAGLGPPPSVLRATAGGRGRGREGPPPVAAGRGRGPGPVVVAGDTAPVLVSASPVLAASAAMPSIHDQGGAAAAAGASLGQDLHEEYDPARPNDYEQVRKERERQRRCGGASVQTTHSTEL